MFNMILKTANSIHYVPLRVTRLFHYVQKNSYLMWRLLVQAGYHRNTICLWSSEGLGGLGILPKE